MNQPIKQAESTALARTAALARTDELTLIYAALTALKRGDPSARLPMHGSAGFSKGAEVINDLGDQNVSLSDDVQRV